MDVLKKIAGVILLIFAGLLAIATLYSGFNSMNECINRFKNSAEGIGFLLGTIIGLIILFAIVYFTAKFGFKLIRKKKTAAVDSIDDIGK